MPLIMSQSVSNTTSNTLVFERELARFGPDQATPASLPAAQSYCRKLATSRYENFVVASCLLPKPLRQDFYNVYAYCRWSDDLADEIADSHRSLELLHWWQRQLEICYAGSPLHPVMVALQQTIRLHALPSEPFADLLSAFRQDQTVNRYKDSEQLVDYCRRSANPVGRIVLRMAKVVDDESFQLSDKICTGLQLANFCQDMSRDAQIDRIYAPRALWDRHHVTEQMLLDRRITEPLRSLLAEWVGTAREYLCEGWPLVEQVPVWLRTDVELFVRGGLAILAQIETADYDVWTHRPKVSKLQQMRLLTTTWLRRWLGPSRPPLTSHAAVPSVGSDAHV